MRCLHLSGYFKVEKDTREPVLPQTALLTEYFPKYWDSCKEDIEVLYIPKMLGFKSKVDMAECFSRKHWTVFTPRWYRTPHSSYIQNNHVYRIIPLKQRKKNEPIIKLAVLKSSLNFEFCDFTNNTNFFLPLFFVSYLSIIALNVQSERAHNLQTG